MAGQIRLFFKRNPYKTRNNHLFLDVVKQNIQFHRDHNIAYAWILDQAGFSPDDLRSEEDLAKIPPIPTLYFKRNQLFTIAPDKLVVKATSSGTKGRQSQVGFDRGSLLRGILMMLRFFIYHRVISLVPTNYIVLGYQPSAHTDMGAIKTAYGTTKFAPALHREYALKDNGQGYDVNTEGVKAALLRYARRPWPVRFVGFPAYMYFLAQQLKDHGITLKLNRHSKILLGGGWKQFAGQEIDREAFYGLIKETLGIGRENCLEFFSAVEHPLAYCRCKNGHFHVPAYSRVIIRDVATLAPLSFGKAGLLSFVSPLVSSMPLISVVTDDIALAQDGKNCGCGIEAPYFDLLGRAGVTQIKTCAADAADLLQEAGQ